MSSSGEILTGRTRGLRSSAKERPGTTTGSQGAALVLELQRIQEAFHQQQRSGPKASSANGNANGGGPASKSKRRRRPAKSGHHKGAMTRAVDACLQRLGFSGARMSDPSELPAEELHPATNPGRVARHHDAGATRQSSVARIGETMAFQRAASISDRRRPIERPDREFEAGAQGSLPVRRSGRDEQADDVQAGKGGVTRALGVCGGYLRSGYGFLVKGDGTPVGDSHGEDLATRIRRTFETELRSGLRVLIFGVGLVGGWAALMPLSGAVVVAGNLIVESNVKKVQHPTGGVVAEIPVRDGLHVNEGDLLARLDATQARASLQVITKQLDEFRSRIARLVAERDDSEELKVPLDLTERPTDHDVEQLIASENTLFKARKTARQTQKDLLRGHVGQLGEQISGLNAQIDAKAAQLDLISGELQGVQTLYDKHLVPLMRLTALQRDAARLEGERGQLVSAIAEARSKISEEELQIVRIDQDFRTDVMKDLREAQGKEAELVERSVSARDLLNRIDIRASASGVVHQLAVHTIGGVVAAGEVIMEIVPDKDSLQIEARLQPHDIDQVRIGQKSLVRFPAFNQRTTPQLSGSVSYISADLSHDKQTNAAYYTVRTTLPGEERRRLGELHLISGMPVEVFLQTGSRTMLSYLFKPITDQIQRAFNER